VCGPGVRLEKDNASLEPGQWLELVTPGAGGYGVPEERARTAIARDLAEGVIDTATARRVYGFKD